MWSFAQHLDDVQLAVTVHVDHLRITGVMTQVERRRDVRGGRPPVVAVDLEAERRTDHEVLEASPASNNTAGAYAGG